MSRNDLLLCWSEVVAMNESLWKPTDGGPSQPDMLIANVALLKEPKKTTLIQFGSTLRNRCSGMVKNRSRSTEYRIVE